MHVFFIYKNNTFNFNIKKDVSITYLKNVVSKMIQKDKSYFDLFYNNKILTENNSTLFQIAKNETDIPIIVSLKKNNKSNSENKNTKLPFLTLPNKPILFKEDNDENNIKLNLNESDIFSNSLFKDLNQRTNLSIQTSTGIRANQKKYTTVNKVFEDIYNTKEENVINLMKELKAKILEYDDVLYKNKYNNNNQLLLFEKNIIDFKDRQIMYLKKLINYFDGKEASFFSPGTINLEVFYQELLRFNNSNTNTNYFNNNTNTNIIIKNYSNPKEKKIKIINEKKNEKLPNYSNYKLPKLTITKNIDERNNIIISNKPSEDSFSEDVEEIKETVDRINKISLRKTPKIEKSKTINKSQNLLDSLEPKESNIEKKVLRSQNPITKKENKLKLIYHHPFDKDNNKTEKNVERKNNHFQYPSSKSIDEKTRELRESFNKNKIGALFDISENKNENTENDSEEESNSDNIYYKKEKNKEKIERNFNDRKKTLHNLGERESIIGYKIKLKDKKKTHRISKLGNNLSDFIF